MYAIITIKNLQKNLRMNTHNDNETNKGILYSTFKQYAPELLDFEKLNYEYFKNSLTDSDVLTIVAQIAFEQSVFLKKKRSKRNCIDFGRISKLLKNALNT